MMTYIIRTSLIEVVSLIRNKFIAPRYLVQVYPRTFGLGVNINDYIIQDNINVILVELS